jgi:hypothetical protein
MHYRRRTPASRFAQAERKAQAERDAGIADRVTPPLLPPVLIDLRGAGGPHWRCEHKPASCRWLVYDADTGARVMCGQIGGILTAAHKATPRMRPADDEDGYSARDEADAAAA